VNTDSGTALDFAGLISTGQTALDNTMASSLPKKGRIACQPANCPCAKPGCFGPAQSRGQSSNYGRGLAASMFL